MLITLIDVISCENPSCREFAKPVLHRAHQVRSYYCQVCGKVSYPRAVDASLASSPDRFKAYLRKAVLSASHAPRS